jgi:hypothetical protein
MISILQQLCIFTENEMTTGERPVLAGYQHACKLLEHYVGDISEARQLYI